MLRCVVFSGGMWRASGGGFFWGVGTVRFGAFGRDLGAFYIILCGLRGFGFYAVQGLEVLGAVRPG